MVKSFHITNEVSYGHGIDLSSVAERPRLELMGGILREADVE